jgi:hypothetical protein
MTNVVAGGAGRAGGADLLAPCCLCLRDAPRIDCVTQRGARTARMLPTIFFGATPSGAPTARAVPPLTPSRTSSMSNRMVGGCACCWVRGGVRREWRLEDLMDGSSSRHSPIPMMRGQPEGKQFISNIPRSEPKVLSTYRAKGLSVRPSLTDKRVRSRAARAYRRGSPRSGFSPFPLLMLPQAHTIERDHFFPSGTMEPNIRRRLVSSLICECVGTQQGAQQLDPLLLTDVAKTSPPALPP